MSEPLEIPYERLSPEALRGIVEEFVLREGTDYGAKAYSLEEKVEMVMEQLRRGEASVLYDPTTQTCNLALKQKMAARKSCL